MTAPLSIVLVLLACAFLISPWFLIPAALVALLDLAA